MPRRELLTPTERLQLLAFPEDVGELIRVLTLSKADIAFVRQHRGDHNRFGIAVLMAYLRYPGRTLAKDENPHVPVLNLIAEQLQIPGAARELYADRDETRREHLVELLSLLDMKQFSTRHYRALSEWLEPTALQTTRGMVLAQVVVEELRKRLIVLPPVTVIERLCAEAATRAQRKILTILSADLSPEQKSQLDGLLEMREGSPYSTLAWLRLPPGAPTARAILAHIERLRAIRELQISPEASRRMHQNRLLQLAREAGQTAVYHFKDYEPDRRYGTLVALMIETAATVTDEILDLNDRLIGSFFTKAKNKYERAFAEQGKAINDKVRLYAKVGAALVSPAAIGDAISRHGRSDELQELLPIATAQARRGKLSFSIQRALCVFFLSCRKVGLYSTFHALERVKSKSAYIQYLLIPYFLSEDFLCGGIAGQLVQGASPLPGMVLAEEMVERNLSLPELGVQVHRLIGDRPKSHFDQIGDILRTSYGVRYWRGWRTLLGSNYQRALQFLLTAENKVNSDKSGWLASQNSFKDLVFGAFQDVLNARSLPGAMRSKRKKQQVDIVRCDVAAGRTVRTSVSEDGRVAALH